MLDKTIPFYNTIMKCSDYAPRRLDLLDGFSTVSYQYGYEKEWAKLEYTIGDFDSSEAAEKYFVETYLQNSELFPNILFLLNKEHNVVGSCIAWQDIRGENSVSCVSFCMKKILGYKENPIYPGWPFGSRREGDPRIPRSRRAHLYEP